MNAWSVGRSPPFQYYRQKFIDESHFSDESNQGSMPKNFPSLIEFMNVIDFSFALLTYMHLYLFK